MHKMTLGKLTVEILKHRAANAWKNWHAAAAVTTQVIADTNASSLTSKDRLAIIQSLRKEFLTPDAIKELVGMAEALNYDHRGKAVFFAMGALRLNFDIDNSEIFSEIFDRLATLVETFQTDEEKKHGLTLLQRLWLIQDPTQRLPRFERLAPLSTTIESEREKAESFYSIRCGINSLSLQHRDDQFHEYVDVARSIQDADAKATAISYLAHCINSLTPDKKKNGVETLLELARSIEDNSARQIVMDPLRDAVYGMPARELPPNERDGFIARINALIATV
jgi:hypothetical protein